MTFISYGQNLEDVMLHRALKHVESGFYIDVGAWHPIIDSVTKAFYDRGWRGINIEPNLENINLLQQHRPEDINLNMAVSDHNGTLIYYEVLPHTGLSTIMKDLADWHQIKEDLEIKSQVIPCSTLDAICDEYRINVVQFLKIDAEGAEELVLRGFAFKNVRPWIVIMEVGDPNTKQNQAKNWGSFFSQHDYDEVYYDGLNSFWLASEQSDLRVHFNIPPNLWDDYISYPHWLIQQGLTDEKTRRESLETQLTDEKTRRESLETQLTDEKTRRGSLEAELLKVYMSCSWKMTAPLRWGYRKLFLR